MSDKKISALTVATTPLAGTEVLPIVQSSTTKQVSVANLTAGRDISTTGITVSSNTGNIELNWDTGSTHKVGSTFSTSFFTGMRVDADTRNTDIVSFDASGIGNVRIRTGTTETTRLNVDPTGNVTVSTGNLVIGTSGKGIDFSATAGTGTSELLSDYEEGTWTPTDGSGVGLSFTNTTNNCFYTKVGNLVTCVFSLVYPSTASAFAAVIAGLPFTSKNTGNSTFGGYTTYTDSSLNINYLVAGNGTTAPLYLNTGSTVTNVQLSTRSLRGVIIYAV
jgi:hypothetical protein